jgi:hypothetical protein
MPYIEQHIRPFYDGVLNELQEIKTKGDLEYCIFKLMLIYMKNRKGNYSNLHDCAYAAQHCCDEFRRRLLDTREDYAIETNGDLL